MYPVKYFLTKVLYKLRRNDKETVSAYFRRQGMTIGKGCNICCNIMNTEPYLITIGDNVTVSGGVKFTTHDNSISKVLGDKTDICVPIKIGNNCFIGRGSMILLGVHLADNIIVAAGSVVTKSFAESRIIIAGNPAKKIGTWDSFAERYKDKAVRLKGLSAEDREAMIKQNLVLK